MYIGNYLSSVEATFQRDTPKNDLMPNSGHKLLINSISYHIISIKNVCFGLVSNVKGHNV